MNVKDFYEIFCHKYNIKKRESYLKKLKIGIVIDESRIPLKKRLNYKNPTLSPTSERLAERIYNGYKCLEKTQVVQKTTDTFTQTNQSETMSVVEIVHDWPETDSTNEILQQPETKGIILNKISSSYQSEFSDCIRLCIVPAATDDSNKSENEKPVEVATQTNTLETLPQNSDIVKATEEVNFVTKKYMILFKAIKDSNITIEDLQHFLQRVRAPLPRLHSDAQTDHVTIISENEEKCWKIFKKDNNTVEYLQNFQQHVRDNLESDTQTDHVTIIYEEQKELLNFLNEFELNTIQKLRSFYQKTINNNNPNCCDNLNQLENNKNITLPENKEKQCEDKENLLSILKRSNIKCSTMHLLRAQSDLNKLILKSLYKGLNLLTTSEAEKTSRYKELCQISDNVVEAIFEIIFQFIEENNKQSKVLDIIDLVEEDDNVECEFLSEKRPATSEMTDTNKCKQAKIDENIQKQQTIESNETQQTQTTAPKQVTRTQTPDLQQRATIQEESPPPYIQRMHSIPNIDPYEERLQRKESRLPRDCNPNQPRQQKSLGKQPLIRNNTFLQQHMRPQFPQVTKNQQQIFPPPSHQTPTFQRPFFQQPPTFQRTFFQQPLLQEPFHQQPQTQDSFNNDHNFLNPVQMPQNTFGERSGVFENILNQDMQYSSANYRNSYFFNYPKR